MKYFKILIAIACLAFSSLSIAMYFDKESGLHQNGFREYRPPDGRYTQPDPIGLDGGPNPFVYVDGNPLNFADPDGLQIKGIRIPVTPLEGIGGGGAPFGSGGSGGVLGGSGGGVVAVPGVGRTVVVPSHLPRSAAATGKYCESPSESTIWKSFVAYKGGTRTNAQSGKDRRYFEWDHTHGDIEVYDRTGSHLGSMNPITGELHKPAVKGRSLKGL